MSDTVSCVEYLVKEGLVDEKRVAISGGSAGGFTVLAALCRSPETFAAGISWYGISDLDRLADDTHKVSFSEALIGKEGSLITPPFAV